ncbi:conserved exported protein of unknown function [Rhodovastum atsumiense]|nr:conserved exported protein of unknown function [Rhodovastum atsumiense]
MPLPTRLAVLLGGAASIAAGFSGPAAAQDWVSTKTPTQVPYVAGDFHNHTTCMDGSVSVQWLLDKSVGTWGLDWFVHANHGGLAVRDCRFNDPDIGDLPGSGGPAGSPRASGDGKTHYLDQSIGQSIRGITINKIKGDAATSSGHQGMWRWQQIQEIDYPIIIERSKYYRKVIINGLEQNVPGHEHADTAVLAGQFPASGTGNANAMAQYEFLFDRSDSDTQGDTVNGVQAWPGKITTNSGTAGHGKTVAGVAWMQANYPLGAYMSPTHVERQGMFNPNGSNGYNIEHFRDLNNAGPTVAFGFDGPGHQAESSRGSYGSGAVGNGTFGGRGIYVAQIGNVWDAMLAEGRNWFYFGSSDYHSRGIFGPTDRYSTADFYPGEYERNYIPNTSSFRAQSVVDGLRSGNSFNVFGDLIGPDFTYRACVGSVCKTMGETLVVNPGDTVKVEMRVLVPGKNNSPYTFNNPILAQVGIQQPLNAPVLDHVDFIKGNITGLVAPTDPAYTLPVNAAPGTTSWNPQKAPTPISTAAALYKTFDKTNWQSVGTRRVITFTIPNVQQAFFLRARGTNLPQGVPNATDSQGNPMADNRSGTNAEKATQEIICADAACPAHLPTSASGSGQKVVDNDVRGWSSLWFYANPIFVRLATQPKLPVEVAADLAKSLATASK